MPNDDAPPLIDSLVATRRARREEVQCADKIETGLGPDSSFARFRRLVYFKGSTRSDFSALGSLIYDRDGQRTLALTSHALLEKFVEAGGKDACDRIETLTEPIPYGSAGALRYDTVLFELLLPCQRATVDDVRHWATPIPRMFRALHGRILDLEQRLDRLCARPELQPLLLPAPGAAFPFPTREDFLVPLDLACLVADQIAARVEIDMNLLPDPDLSHADVALVDRWLEANARLLRWCLRIGRLAYDLRTSDQHRVTRLLEVLVVLMRVEAARGNVVAAGAVASFVLTVSDPRLAPQLYNEMHRRALAAGLRVRAFDDERLQDYLFEMEGKSRAIACWRFWQRPEARRIADDLKPLNASEPRYEFRDHSVGYDLLTHVEKSGWRAALERASDRQLSALFDLAVLHGLLRKAGSIAEYLDERYKNAKGEQGRPPSVPGATVLAYARLLSEFETGAALFLDVPMMRIARQALRTVWKLCDDSEWSDRERLFVQLVKAGTVARSRSGFTGEDADALFGVLYQSATALELARVPRLAWEAVAGAPQAPAPWLSLQIDDLRIAPGEAFVSVVTRRGDELRIIAVGKGVTHSRQVSLAPTAPAPDFPKCVTRWVKTASDLAEVGYQPPRDSLLEAVARCVDELVNEIDPNTRCISLHTDAVLRAMPWQWMLQRVRPAGDSMPARLICHVPGLEWALPDASDVSAGVPTTDRPSVWRSDDRPVCLELSNQIEALGPCSLAHQTVIAHGNHPVSTHQVHVVEGTRGRGSSGAVLLRDGRALDGTELREIPIRAQMLLHVCGGAFDDFGMMGDMAGLPGFMVSHGAREVLASSVAIYPDTALAIEQLLRDPAFVNDTLEDHYRRIIREVPRGALYAWYCADRGMRAA